MIRNITKKNKKSGGLITVARPWFIYVSENIDTTDYMSLCSGRQDINIS